MNHLDLFTGIGGFTIGLQNAGFTTVAQCENEPYCHDLLGKQFPDILLYDDVRTLTYEGLKADGLADIGIITAGFPCTDLSVAGRQEGIEAERSGLWSETARIIGEVRPRYFILENVTAILSGDDGRWLATILRDVAALGGYALEWHCLAASEFGYDHHRDRWWAIGYAELPIPHADSTGLEGWAGEILRECEIERVARPRSPYCRTEWNEHGVEIERDLRGNPHGLYRRSHRLKALGNAVVPAIPEALGRAILARG